MYYLTLVFIFFSMLLCVLCSALLAQQYGEIPNYDRYYAYDIPGKSGDQYVSDQRFEQQTFPPNQYDRNPLYFDRTKHLVDSPDLPIRPEPVASANYVQETPKPFLHKEDIFPLSNPVPAPKISRTETAVGFKGVFKREFEGYKLGMKRFYKWDKALNYTVALGGAAVLANTSIDQNFRNWYQDDVRSNSTDDFASGMKVFGEGKYLVPSVVILSIGFAYQFENNPYQAHFNTIQQWSSRSTRAYLVGTPTLLIAQLALGAGRPNDPDHGSRWIPFNDDHGVSGHAFIGAVPFITAAQMTDKRLLKTLLYAGSVLPAWSRVNDDAHYLSQVILGWYLAYISCRSISETINPSMPKGLQLFPVCDSQMTGIGFIYRR